MFNFYEKQSNTKKEIFLYLTYIFLFISTSKLCFLYFTILNKGFYQYDGCVQHITALAYLGQYLRGFFKAIFIEHNFQIPQFDFTIGYGADIIQSIHYYSYGDPLNLLSIFFTPEKTEKLYSFLIYFRIFLAGVSFLFFARHNKINRYFSLCGAFVYAFCGYTFYVAVMHPFFMQLMYYFPIACVGFDLLLSKNKFSLFTISIFLSCISNFYFFYMLTFLLFIYAIIKFCFTYSKNNFSASFFVEFWKIFVKTTGAYLLGILMAAFIFFPIIYGFFDSSRTGEHDPITLFYNLKYYVKMILCVVSPGSFFSYSLFGFAAPAIPFVAYNFTKTRKKETEIKTFLGVLIGMMLFPFFASLFNGFNYLTNRWSSVVALPVAFSFAYTAQNLLNEIKSGKIFEERKLKICILGCLIFSFFIILGSLRFKKLRTDYLPSYLILFLFCVGVYIFITKKINFKFFILPFVIISIFVNSTVRYSPNHLGYLTYERRPFHEKGFFTNYQLDNPALKIKEIEKNNTFYRVESDSMFQNQSCLQGQFSNNYYWSINPSILTDFYDIHGISTANELDSMGLNNRFCMENLLGIKYKIRNGEIFKTENPAPFIFGFENRINFERYSKLDIVEKQAAILQGAVIPNTDENNNILLPEIEISVFRKDFLSTLEPSDDKIEIEDNKVIVKDTNSYLIFTPKEELSGESYVEVKNWYYLEAPWEDPVISFSDDTDLNFSQKIWEFKDRGHNYLFCLGENPTTPNFLKVKFECNGTYSFEDLKFTSIDLSSARTALNNINKDITEKLEFKTNGLFAKINCNKNQFVCFSMPYSRHWKAFVDGKQTNTYKAQEVLLGLLVEKGSHEIVLKYKSPFFSEGLAVSLFATIFFIGLIIIQKKKKGNKKL